jgi:sigma-E factor negative regulatory protein RseA
LISAGETRYHKFRRIFTEFFAVAAPYLDHIMKTENTQNLSISSLLDGELSDAQLDSALASLGDAGNPDGRATWELYHQIGDVLRSDDLAIALSPDFSARFSALLDAEPVVLAPKLRVVATPLADAPVLAASPRKQGIARYIAMTSMALAASVAFFMAPQILPMLDGQTSPALRMSKAEAPRNLAPAGIQLASNAPESAPEPSAQAEGQIEMLRDPRLDSYLLAHQKFSPSMSNGAQYVTRANAVTAAAPSSSASGK